MSFTRFHDDINRIKKKNLEQSEVNNYIFNVPGNIGLNNIGYYYNDPHIRMQKMGVKLNQNIVDCESELRSINKPINRDHINVNNYLNYKTKVKEHSPENVNKTITSESRATHPVWNYRETNQYRPDYLFLNPQENVVLPFHNNLDTNILEKDYYNLKVYKKI